MTKPQGRGRKYALLLGAVGVLLAGVSWLIWMGESTAAPGLPAVPATDASQMTAAAAESPPLTEPSADQLQTAAGAELQSHDASLHPRDPSSPPSWQVWDERFHAADDMVAFMNQAREAAESGDAVAAWMMFESIIRCLGPMRAISRGEQAVQEHLKPGGMAYHDERTVRDFHRCRGVLDAFAGEHASPDDYMRFSIQHWRQTALELGSPRARMDAVVSLMMRLEDSRDTIDIAGTIKDVRSHVRQIVQSDDALALTQLGLRLSQGDVSKDWRYGMAMFLAGCEMGYDCSADNPNSMWAICRRHPENCSPDSSFRGELEASLPAKKYAQVDALAEQFKEAHRRGMYEDMARFHALDGPLMKMPGTW